MKIKYTYIALLFLLLLCCSKRGDVNEYSKYLGVDFPDNLEAIDFYSNSNLQDYSNYFIYPLNNLQRNNLINEINFKLCDSTKMDCWKRHGDYYSFKISDSTLNSGYYIEAMLTNNDFNILAVKEMKWK